MAERAIFPAEIITGNLSQFATTAATTFLTIPAARTWKGSITIVCSCFSVAALATTAEAIGSVSTAGAGVSPAAGIYWGCFAFAGANAAAGTAGSEGNNSAIFNEVWIAAPAANTVQLQLASTIAGSGGGVSVSASGTLQPSYIGR